MEMEVIVLLQMGNPFTEIYGGAADSAVDIVAFLEEKFGEIGAVLAGDTGDECCFHIILKGNKGNKGNE